MKLFSLLLKDSRRIVLLATVSSALSGACTALLLSVIHRAVGPPQAGGARVLILQFAGVSLLFFAATLGSHIPLLYLSEGAILKLRMHLVKGILKGRLRYLEELGGHRLYAALAGDVDRITDGLAVIPAILISTVILSGCLVYLGVVSWRALAALLVFMVFAIGIFVAANGRAVQRLTQAREVGNVLFKQFRAVAEGTKELKLHGPRRKSFLETVLFPAASSYRTHRIAGLARMEGANAIANLGYFVVIGFLLFLLPALQTMDRQVLADAVLVFVFMLAPLTTLGNHFHTFAQAGVALRQIESLGVSLAEDENAETAENAGADRPRLAAIEGVVLAGVDYSYTDAKSGERFTLGPMNVELRPAEILFITGGNGSGKSTLGKLIVGLYEPASGSIRLNGEEVVELNRDWYRQHFTAIFADFYLFDRLLGIESDPGDGRARKYLADLHLEEKLTIADGVLSTTDLSAGQRKRLALLVAYMEDRPICLFDEWAADQDPQFKEIFYRQLLPELKSRGKSVVVITHDDRYFPQADRILKLADGQLVA
jgi:putative ATP-binding cassette transporter